MAPKPPSQASGLAAAPNKGTKRKVKKPAIVKRVEQIAGAINSLNPFD